ncbi:phosphatase PAP2 family protein [Clostridium manihotivorum]|uniref:Phosphatase PAP2 family protein n=1 Tax=Clostridium manihotivorum TaxID=2320868 RepID=A0A410DUV0_9CLOT|nr:phosphatase PAP2 family protein [Clostridium manihotivorum]ERI90630.1 PAP2 family protein [Clostridiales bacterium oral taxon 876 str. F0540]QAA32859.1 phosphatase PAP2 family protein [Clostridium manihotivorum]
MNMELFRLINNLAYKDNVLDVIMIVFSKYVPYLFMAIIAIVFLLGIFKKNSEYRKSMFSIFVFTLMNLFISFIVGSIYYVDRPFVHNKVNLLFPHAKDASFPSDHATGTMSIALGFGKYNKAISLTLSILSSIVGFSRVYVGHHYPADVISAYTIVFIVNYIYNLKLRNRVEELYEILEKKVAYKLGFKALYN